jgi:hypothetical protein
MSNVRAPWVRVLSQRSACAALWLAALACAAASLYFMYSAGCAGDLKGGSLGNLPLALKTESMGILLAWVGIALATLAAAARRGLVLQQRIARVLAVLFLGAVALTIMGIQLEFWGVQHCLVPK